jgi:ABC-type multidrug transport system fused ATPase/permease subunit
MEDKKPQFTSKQKFDAVLHRFSPYKKIFIVLSVLGIISAVANGVVPYIVGKFLDGLITPSYISLPLFGTVPLWAALLSTWVVLQIIANTISWEIDRRTRVLTTDIEVAAQADAFIKLLQLPISFHKNNRAGEITEIINKTSWMSSSLATNITTLAPQFLTIIVGVAISFALRPSLALVLLAGVVIYLIVLVRILPRTAKYQEEGMKAWSKAYGDGADAYANFQTVKHSNAEEFERDRISKSYSENAVPLWNKMGSAWSNLNFSQRIIVTATQGIIFLFSVYLIGHHELTIGGLIAFNAYAGMIMGPFVSLGTQWQTIQNALIQIARSEVIFQSPSEIYAPADAVPLVDFKGEIAFNDVHFTYEEGQPEVLKGLSFTVKAGEVVAFVGETGAGKSTTAELISGYYFANSGSVEVDGKDIRKVNLTELRSHIAIVPQEVVLFNGTIAENIRYGRPDATDEEVQEAARKAHADVYIENFPLKYEQIVGERGVKLSVGQKQRVAIARAVLRNPRILILDEPTSALDAETEQYITKSLEELMQGRTTFIIAHRLSTVRQADKIIVLKDGKVAEQGTHAELIAIPGGSYKHLYELHVGLHS